ncbi:hypothetical protein Amac_073670 [Acrocarpospora macrocephala]|uniref:Uncharacterized protein n=1 Tax=Acrocarpospora macrocephala TaxID=150177 RepID=A0A5M3WYF2_9ACTN|nr:hypothetical protein Amac_073670 [Acrocarpospora macrocephala]
MRGGGVVVEAERRAWERDAAEDGVVDVDQEALRVDLVPAVDLVDGADGSGGNAEVGERGQPVCAIVSGQGFLHVGDQLIPMRKSFPICRIFRDVGVDV